MLIKKHDSDHDLSTQQINQEAPYLSTHEPIVSKCALDFSFFTNLVMYFKYVELPQGNFHFCPRLIQCCIPVV